MASLVLCGIEKNMKETSMYAFKIALVFTLFLTSCSDKDQATVLEEKNGSPPLEISHCMASKFAS